MMLDSLKTLHFWLSTLWAINLVTSPPSTPLLPLCLSCTLDTLAFSFSLKVYFLFLLKHYMYIVLKVKECCKTYNNHVK
jgi:hypothetical protein